MKIKSMDIVVLTDINRCLYIVDGKVLVNTYDEGSEEYDHMFGRFSDVTGVEYESHTMTRKQVKAKWSHIKNKDLG